MEKELQLSKENLHLIFDNTSDGILIADAETKKFTLANNKVCKMLGYTEDEIMKLSVKDIHPDESIESGLKEFDRLLKKEIQISGNMPVKRKDGTVFYADISASPLPIEGKTYLIGSFRDITQRKQAEKALSLRLKFEQLVSHISSELAGISSKKEIDVVINKALASIGEFSGADRAYVFLFRNDNKIMDNTHEWCNDNVHPEIENLQNIYMDKELPWFSKQIREQEVFHVPDVLSMPSEAHLEQQHFSLQGIKSLIVVPMRIGSKLIGFLGFDAVREYKKWDDDHLVLLRLIAETFANVIERNRSEEKLKEIQSQLSNAIEMANLGPWEYDVATDTFTFNDYFYRIFRTTAEEVGGYKMKPEEYAKRFLHPDDIPNVREETQKALETADPNYKIRTEHRIVYPDGTIGHVSVQIFIVKDSSGNTIKTYGVNQDITELKRLEEEFIKSQKIESIGTLAGGIAHDFNNILTAILGNVMLAMVQVSPESEVFELLSEAEKASKRAQALTKQLLTFAKGGMPVKETSDIKDIIKESSLFVTRGAKSRCDFSIAEDLWPADVDTGQISQVINNIVINANQAMPEGGIIHIDAKNISINEESGREIKPGKYIRISIKDEGTGIAKKYLSKIFDPYFSTKQAGSGLGLATSYSIINNHGGLIRAESVMGAGTTFHIYLPASEKQVAKKEESKIIKGKGRILVMDDEEALRKVLKIMLTKLGYEVEIAKEGSEAIKLYKKAKESGNPYNAVILDLTVPGGMGGKEAIQKLLEVDPLVKAIVSSGYSDDPVLSNYERYGFKGIVAKPFEAVILSKALHEVLKNM